MCAFGAELQFTAEFATYSVKSTKLLLQRSMQILVVFNLTLCECAYRTVCVYIMRIRNNLTLIQKYCKVTVTSCYLAKPSMQLRGLGERCKLPHRVQAEPGRQTTFGAFLV